MNTPFDFDANAESKIVYVRPVKVADLPSEVREQAMGVDEIYAVHNADGQRLALVRDRRMAFLLAREHDLAAVNVH
ncbi:DUF1150 family protein [Ovoidimarina sediminis]|uniref:DUF1150 family protein n=1 Tax=Ovoidimarina sediminis TaxID=3079856 RepID=UPI002910E72E|nr:DUF1150 family protein [Rhodophyticola sp. MJ-SS7]MDU8944732.1 DUF1150 family protein [Rhodophyticola sp. MJ-SS7]